ncbi:MAG: hypothetical protein ACTSPY_00495 [Candidatus Helarchaeota archaeon]
MINNTNFIKIRKYLVIVLLILTILTTQFSLFHIINNTMNDKINDTNEIMKRNGINQLNLSNTYEKLYSTNRTEALLNCSIRQKFSGQTNNSIIINTQNWNYTNGLFLFGNISSSYTELIEILATDKVTVFSEEVLSLWTQAFSISNDYVKIDDIELYLRYRGEYDLWIDIYNATKVTGRARPDSIIFKSQITNVDFQSSEGISEWVSFNFINRTLYRIKTYDNTFFISLNGVKKTGFLSYVEWWYDLDSNGVDAGSVYYYQSGSWISLGVDLDSILYLGILYYPNDVNMKINDTSSTYVNVLNGPNPGNGYINITRFIDNENIEFEIFASLNLNYTLNLYIDFINKSNANTQFYSESSSSKVNINITINANFIDGSFNNKLKIILNSKWNITSVSAGGFIVGDSNWERNGNYILINATSDKYSIKCIDNNYIKKLFFNNNKKLFFINNNLTVNTSFLINSSSVPVNLTIKNNLNATINTQTELLSNYFCQFDPVNMTENGLFSIIVWWFNGTSMGFNSTSLEVLYHTELYNIKSNINLSVPFNSGEDVFIDAYFNNTDLNTGIINSSSFFIINMTTYSQYNVSEYGNGFYNITIFTHQLSSRNYTLVIAVNRIGYQISNFTIKFSVIGNYNATLNITGYYGNEYRNGSWWISPNPYFDDNTHKVRIEYKNGTSPYDGIYPAAIYAYPNWSEDIWYGNPFGTSGQYDIIIDTLGLHEGDIGEILIIATSNEFETKEIKIFLEIDEIPENLLSFDITGYNELTAYEGETVQIATGFLDNFHGNNIVFENNSQGNLTWTIPGTSASGVMSKIISIYIDNIDLNTYNIPSGDYNITIKGNARRDYATKEINISLHILNKEPTKINITYYTETEIRIGNSLYIYSNLTFINDTSLSSKILNFNLTFANGTEIIDEVSTTILTDQNGIATYLIAEIPDNINKIIINCSYQGTEKIAPVNNSSILDVLDKYQTLLKINTEYTDDIRVGRNITFHANLSSIVFGAMTGENLLFNITYDYKFKNSTTLIYKTFITNENGTVSYTINHIKEGVNSIIIEVIYFGTKTYHGSYEKVNYTVNNKYNTTLEILTQLPNEIMVGNYVEIDALLTNTEKSQPVSGAKIVFTLGFSNGLVVSQEVSTASNGIAHITIQIPTEASNSEYFTITIQYGGDFSIQNTSIHSLTIINVLTPIKLFIRFLPYILITIGIITFSLITYQYGIRAPRIRRKLRRIKEVNQKFMDILNIQHLMIIYKSNGMTLYDYSFQERTFDPDLISGFLTAIASFQEKSLIKKQSEKSARGGFELTYANFIILVDEGDYVRVALILDQKPSETIRNTLKRFIKEFEIEYTNDLKSFAGYVKAFRKTSELIVKIFESSLIWPHRVDMDINSELEKELSSFEGTVLALALTIQKERNFFMAPALIDAVKEVRKTSTEEVLAAFDDLRKKGIFISFPPDQLERVIEESHEQMQIKELSTSLEEDKNIIPKIKGVPAKELKYINKRLFKTSFIFQKLILQQLFNVPENKRPNLIRNYIKTWNNQLMNKDSIISQAKSLIEKGKNYNAIMKFNEARNILDDLGLDNEATQIANEIFKLIEQIKKSNPDQYNELINIFVSELKKYNKEAESEILNNNPIKVCLLYKKAARIALQIGDNESTQSFINAAKEYENNI